MQSDNSFPRDARLTSKWDYKRVYNRPARSRSGFFNFVWTSNDLGVARLGLAISRKSAKRAVDRHRIKRLVRDSFRHARGSLPSIDVIVSCRSGVSQCSNAEVRKALENQWRKLSK